MLNNEATNAKLESTKYLATQTKLATQGELTSSYTSKKVTS
jgi:hypothetical protein